MSGIGTVANASAVTITAAAETTALTIPFSTGNSANVSLACPPGTGKTSKNRIAGTLNITVGTAGTAVVIRCRQTSLTGTVVDVSETDTIAAGASGTISYDFVDTAAGFAQAYVITVQQTSATGNGTVNFINGSVTDYN